MSNSSLRQITFPETLDHKTPAETGYLNVGHASRNVCGSCISRGLSLLNASHDYAQLQSRCALTDSSRARKLHNTISGQHGRDGMTNKEVAHKANKT
jgi:hypothetical protein